MKKFTRILICLMLCVCSFAFVACDKRTKEEKNFTYPTVNDATLGNGGLAVRKGNYIYFVNGFSSVSDSSITKDTSYMVGSLMLAKLGADGEIVKNDAGSIRDEYYITMSNALCGYEATDLFIHGEYLYFVTPSLENETGDEVWAKERVVFNRIKLDKTGKVEEVYSSGVKYNKLEYKYYQENGNLFILAWEKDGSYYAENGNNALIRIDANAKSSTLVSNDVTDVVFADKSNEIFFQTHVGTETNYYLKQYNIGGNSITNYSTFEKTFDILAVENGEVFVSVAHDVNFGSVTTDIKSSNIANRLAFVDLFAYSSADFVEVTTDGNVVLVSGNTITFVKSKDETVVVKDESATSIKFIAYTNGCVLYYDTTSENSNIKLVSYSNAIAGSEVEIQTLTTIGVVEDSYAHFDFSEEENLLYFYKKSGDDYYLNRIRVNNNLDSVEEMIGVYEDGDAPVIETEEDEEIEEE